MAKHVLVAAPADFDAAFESAVAESSACFYGLFIGSNKPDTGKSWCPDCVRADPVLRKVLDDPLQVPDGTVVLDCPCARAEYKGHPEYPYRTHARIQLKGVPTLVKWDAEGNVVASICEAPCWDIAMVSAFVGEGEEGAEMVAAIVADSGDIGKSAIAAAAAAATAAPAAAAAEPPSAPKDGARTPPPVPPKPAAAVAGNSGGGDGGGDDGDGRAGGGDGGGDPSAAAKEDVAALLAKDAGDESLARYKAALLGAAAAGDLGADLSDPRRLIVTEFRIVFEDRPGGDVAFPLPQARGAATPQMAFVIKEGANYRFRIAFRVQHGILSGLRYHQLVQRAVFSDTEEVVVGSYAPQSDAHSFETPRRGWNQAPSGFLARGTYTGKINLQDSDGVQHAAFGFKFAIKKKWA